MSTTIVSRNPSPLISSAPPLRAPAAVRPPVIAPAPAARVADGFDAVLAPIELRRGMHGKAVLELQHALQRLGYLSAAAIATGPGIFGPHTEAAVKAFQTRHGIPASGVVGSRTRPAIERALAQHASAPPKPGAGAPGEPAANYHRVHFRGVTVNVRTRELILRADAIGKKLGAHVPIRLTQGSYHPGVSASGHTHDGGGVVDISVSGMSRSSELKLVKALRMAGFAAWSRGHHDGFPPHIHAVALGDRQMTSAAHRQVVAYAHGRDGLADNALDYDRVVGRPVPAWARRYL